MMSLKVWVGNMMTDMTLSVTTSWDMGRSALHELLISCPAGVEEHYARPMVDGTQWSCVQSTCCSVCSAPSQRFAHALLLKQGHI